MWSGIRWVVGFGNPDRCLGIWWGRIGVCGIGLGRCASGAMRFPLAGFVSCVGEKTFCPGAVVCCDMIVSE